MSEHTSPAQAHWLLGRITWDSIPMAHEPIVLATFIAVVLGGLAVLGLLTKFRLWGPLWRDWLCSIDHKKIGIMYRSEEHTSALQSPCNLVCRLLLEKKKDRERF